jgi:5-(carboxyamino)imidazole ribonucleotide synthase
MEHLKGCGVFGIEMFWIPKESTLSEVEGLAHSAGSGQISEEQIFVNEIAPRVHNSGHHTIEACQTSQFEQHIRAVTGMPLGDTSMKVGAAVTINILGDRTGPAEPKGIDEAEKIPGVTVHIYGKHETKPLRKMGHLTAVAPTLDEALSNAHEARSRVTI